MHPFNQDVKRFAYDAYRSYITVEIVYKFSFLLQTWGSKIEACHLLIFLFFDTVFVAILRQCSLRGDRRWVDRGDTEGSVKKQTWTMLLYAMPRNPRSGLCHGLRQNAGCLSYVSMFSVLVFCPSLSRTSYESIVETMTCRKYQVWRFRREILAKHWHAVCVQMQTRLVWPSGRCYFSTSRTPSGPVCFRRCHVESSQSVVGRGILASISSTVSSMCIVSWILAGLILWILPGRRIDIINWSTLWMFVRHFQACLGWLLLSTCLWNFQFSHAMLYHS